MARHRSPRGRRADQPSLLAVPHRVAAGVGAHRSIPTSVKRGTAVAAVTGGAFSLMGATVPLAAPPAALNALALDATVVPATQDLSTQATGVLFQPSVEPVAPTPAPAVADAADLIKAVQLAEQEITRRVAEEKAAEQAAVAAAAVAKEQQQKATTKTAGSSRSERPPPAVGSPGCGLGTSGLGAVKSHVRNAAEFLGCLFGQPDMHGVAGRAGTSDHPSGLALDFMVDRSTGDALAECALRNMDSLGIKYVIWEQQINHGSGWEPMEDRGSATANHFDHVHVSFESRAGGGNPGGC